MRSPSGLGRRFSQEGHRRPTCGAGGRRDTARRCRTPTARSSAKAPSTNAAPAQPGNQSRASRARKAQCWSADLPPARGHPLPGDGQRGGQHSHHDHERGAHRCRQRDATSPAQPDLTVAQQPAGSPVAAVPDERDHSQRRHHAEDVGDADGQRDGEGRGRTRQRRYPDQDRGATCAGTSGEDAEPIDAADAASGRGPSAEHRQRERPAGKHGQAGEDHQQATDAEHPGVLTQQQPTEGCRAQGDGQDHRADPGGEDEGHRHDLGPPTAPAATLGIRREVPMKDYGPAGAPACGDRGNRTLKRAPWSRALVTSTSPPWARTRDATTANPIPDPAARPC